MASKKEIIITDSLIIAGITSIAYLSSFCYQYSFLHYFGIPSYFVEISLVTVLLTFLIVSFCLIFTVLCFIPLFKSLQKKDTIRIALPSYIISYFPAIFLFLFSRDTTKGWGYNVAVLSGVIVIWTIELYLFKKRTLNKFKEDEHNNSFIEKLAKRYGIQIIFFLIFSFLFVFSSLAVGKLVAKTQEEYLVINSIPEVVIIKPYSENFITISFDRIKKTFTQDIYIFKQEDILNKNFRISRDHVGPLTNGGIYIEDDFIDDAMRKITIHLLKVFIP